MTWLEEQELTPGADIHHRRLCRMKSILEESPVDECPPYTTLHAAFQQYCLAYSPYFAPCCRSPLPDTGSRLLDQSWEFFVRTNSQEAVPTALCYYREIAMLGSLGIDYIDLLVGGHSAGTPCWLAQGLLLVKFCRKAGLSVSIGIRQELLIPL